MKSDKAPGNDDMDRNMPPGSWITGPRHKSRLKLMLKELANELKDVLSIIYNRFISESKILPDCKYNPNFLKVKLARQTIIDPTHKLNPLTAKYNFLNCHLVPNKFFRFSPLALNNIFGFQLLAPNKI